MNLLHAFFYRDEVLAGAEREIPRLMKEALDLIARLDKLIRENVV